MQNIPFITLGPDNNLNQLIQQDPKNAQQMFLDIENSYGLASKILNAAAMPLGDAVCKKWLKKNQNPYLKEIQGASALVQKPGAYALNLAYEWGCTSGFVCIDQEIHLLRILDWPFPGLGKTMMVAQHKSSLGDFYNMTWPALSGSFNAFAPGRFAIAINQAPMRRHLGNCVYDWAKNRVLWYKSKALPPSHLLRQVFEQAKDYTEALNMLENTELALPVIFSLLGPGPNQACIIERTEKAFATRHFNPALHNNTLLGTANHFESRFNGQGHGWLPRAIVSDERSRCFSSLSPQDEIQKQGFQWLKYPILNSLSRLAFRVNMAQNQLELVGLEGSEIVTRILKI
ncbi:MAG: hypothetical protein ACKOAD_07775 [Gammaproteobacteria bacterium]